MSGSSPSPSKFVRIQIYNMYRQRIVEEDNVINHRMSWMLWSEAIIFAIWGVLAVPERADKFNPIMIHFALFIIALAGFMVAIASMVSVSAAQKEIDDLVDHYQLNYPTLHGDRTIPRLTGSKRNHDSGHFVPRLMPYGFAILQGLMMLYSVIAFSLHSQAISK